MRELLLRLKAQPFIAMQILVVSLVINLLSLASSLFVIQVFNRYIGHGFPGTLWTLTLGVMLAILLEWLFRNARNHLMAAINDPRDRNLESRAFETLTQGHWELIHRIPPGMRLEVVREFETVAKTLSPVNSIAMIDLPFTLLFLIVIHLLSPMLAMVTALTGVLLLVLVQFNRLRARRDGPMLFQAASGRNALIHSAAQGAETIRIFRGKEFFKKIWEERVLQIQRTKVRAELGTVTMQSVAQSLVASMSVAIIALGAGAVVTGELTTGALIGANLLAARAIQPILRYVSLAESLARIGQIMARFEQFREIPLESTQGVILPICRGGLSLKDLGFRYPKSPMPLFESLTFDLKPGESLGITGPNGSGKTTLIRMILGLVVPNRGQILVDGVAIRQLSSDWWRGRIVYLPQEPTFFSGSIRENILLGHSGIEDHTLRQILETSGMAGYVDHLPDGVETHLPDQGRHLSPGLRLRLALARALITDGPIMIFDEPTEHLDRQGKNNIFEILNRAREQRKTIVVVSQDPEILKGVHHLIDLESKPVPTIQSATGHAIATPSPLQSTVS
ncbi:MAG: ATP-binding cassette domain-containing protein [Magnetococcales bacterium]|nr:ATP-binding cassette domain-containing protein [Magnetococcales bacterium]